MAVHRVVQEILRSRQPQPAVHWLTSVLRKLGLHKHRQHYYWLSLALRLVDEAQQLAGHPQDVRTWPR
ncbi:hypothetical protein [Nitrosococcus oceani]|uniref:hypothetical protein n=1 Tax=Nitrosococcus oceani TaxID=1229 RepID=UPI0012E069A2|nr:hypothetical protein [Nitrosococcus oceani]